MSQVLDELMQNRELLNHLPEPFIKAVMLLVQIKKMKQGGVMPQSVMEACAIDNKLWADIAADGRRNNEPGWLPPAKPDYSRVMIPENEREPDPPRGSGWVTPPPLEPPSGIRIMDRMMDHADAVDRLEQAVKAKFTRRI